MDVYLFENPWPFAILLAAALAVTWLMLLRFQDPRILRAALVLLALLPVPFLLDYLVLTPAEEVEEILDQLSQAAVRGDAEAIVGRLSMSYAHGGLDHAGLASLIRRETAGIRLSSLRLNGRSIVADKDGTVTANFVAVLSGSRGGYTADYVPIRLRLTFQREPDGYRIVRVQRFEPAFHADREIPLQSR